MLKLNDSEPFAVKISANLSKQMRDGCSRQKIVLPSRLPNGFVMKQQVQNLHRAEQINAGLQAAQSAVNQTSVATTDELKETAEAKNVAFNALSKSVTQNSEHNIQCKNVVVNILEDMHRLHDRVTSLVAALPTAQKQVEAASQEGEVFGDDNSSCATENVRDATRSGDDLHGNPPKKARAGDVAVAHPASCTSQHVQQHADDQPPHLGQSRQLPQMPGSQNESAGAATAPNGLTVDPKGTVQGSNDGPNTVASSVPTTGPIVGLEFGSSLGDRPQIAPARGTWPRSSPNTARQGMLRTLTSPEFAENDRVLGCGAHCDDCGGCPRVCAHGPVRGFVEEGSSST
jgi:hypothetical protein